MEHKWIPLKGAAFLLSILVLAGCGVFQIEIYMSDAVGSTSTEMATGARTSLASSPTSDPVIPAIPTVTAAIEEGPAPSSQAYCFTGNPVSGEKEILPSLKSLDWEVEDHDLGPIRKLNGIPTVIWDVSLSPDGRWWAADLLSENFGEGVADVRLYILDAYGDRHWIASYSGDAQFHRYEWLGDGRLLWIDEGNLYLANSDGSDRKKLSTAGTLDEVWLGADYIALAYGDGVLWRVDLDTEQWERVENAPSYANLSLSRDGKTAAFVTYDIQEVNEVEYWFLPLAMGEPAKLAVEGEMLGGHGGSANPPYQVPNAPYWGPNYLAGSMLISQKDGSAISIEEVAHYFEALEMYKFPSYSPDGEWIYLWVEQEPYSYYIAPASDPDSGRLFENMEILGWSSEPAGVLVASKAEYSILLLSLPSGEPRVLLRGLASISVKVGISEEAFFLLPDLKQGSQEISQHQIFAFSNNGERLGTLDLPETTRVSHLTGDSRANLLIQLTQEGDFENSVCKYQDALWYWEVIP